MALDGNRVARFVWQTLKNDAGPGGVSTLLGGRIYRDRVPQASPLPAATVSFVSAPPTLTRGGVRVCSEAVVDVRIIGAGVDYGAILPAADRADAVLNGNAGVVVDSAGSFVVNKLRPDTPLMMIEDEAGTAFSHVIQTYRTEVFV